MVGPASTHVPRGPRADTLTWWIAVLVGLAGIVLSFGFDLGLGDLLFAASAAVMSVAAMRRTAATEDGTRLAVGTAGLTAVVTLALVEASGFTPPIEVVGPIAATGAQLLLFILNPLPETPRIGWGRTAIPVGGHLSVAIATGLIIPGGLTATVVLLYTTGFALLLLETFWVHRALTRDRQAFIGWESAFLLGLTGSIATIAWITVVEGPNFVLGFRDLPTVSAILYAAVLFGVALLAGPPPLDERMAPEAGSVATLIVDAGSFLAVLILLVLLLFVAARAVIVPLFLLLTAWLTVAVTFEYAALIHGLRRGLGLHDPSLAEPEPVTVIIAARNEAEVLTQSVEHNLDIPLDLNFLLVPAASSSDGTVQAAHAIAQDHPGRVRVVEGTGGSKAADLNQAWEHIETDIVLIFDADETTDEASIRRGLELMRSDETIGIVQGRKKSHTSTRRWIDRLVGVERRFSTLVDQTLMGDVFDAAHFSGSAALVRAEVPGSVGGFSPATLTEDIEFTLRLYIEGEHGIAYEPGMIVYEGYPENVPALVRQRGRWARGWGQVYGLHFLSLLRSAPKQGARRTLGLAWQLSTAVSAPLAVLLPAVTVFWLLLGAPVLPGWLAIALGLYILPARVLTYGMPYFMDPLTQERATPVRILEISTYSYVWIVLGWFFQLHALYLELSAAPKVWHATRAPTFAGGPASG